MRAVRISLTTKAVIAIVIVLLPMLVSFIMGYRSSKRQLEKHILDNLTIITEAYEGQVYNFMEMSKRRAQDFASDGFIRVHLRKIIQGEKAAVRPLNEYLIRNKMSLDKSLHGICLISMEGRVLSSTTGSYIGNDLSGTPFFVRGREGLGVYETNQTLTVFPTLAASAPVRDMMTGKVIGVLVNFLSIEELNKVLSGRFAGDLGAVTWDRGRPLSMDVYLVNKDSLMITDSRFTKDSVLKQKVVTLPVNACLESNKEIAALYRNYRGADVAGASMCLPQTKWVLLVEVGLDEVFAPIAGLKGNALIAGAVVVVFIGVLFIMFSRNVLTPLGKIYEASGEIANGNFDIAAIPVGMSDEIGSLSEAFNSMVSEMKLRNEALQAGTTALKESEDSLKRAQSIAHMGNWDWDIVKNKLSWSMEIYRIFGLNPLEFSATFEAFLNSVHPDDREFVKESVQAALNDKKPYEIDHRIVLPDGTIRIVHEHAKVVFDETGQAVSMAGTVQDVTEHREAESELRKLSMIIEHSINVIFVTDINGTIEYVNPMFEKITGWPKEEAIGKTPRILASGETPRSEYEELWQTIGSGRTWRGSFKNKRKGGQLYWGNAVITPIKNDRGEITHFLAVQEDITDRKMSEEKIEYLASYDEMTGLINRSKFMEKLGGWTFIRADNQKGVLLLFDIDEFKFINDSYGHSVGDEIIRHLGSLLQGALTDDDTPYKEGSAGRMLGRMGGDEFAVFLPDLDPKQGLDVAEYLRKRVEAFRPLELPVFFTVSIGVVSYPEHGIIVKELFTKVDAALYRAKELGRNRCHLYRAEDRDLENIHSRLKEKERILKTIADDRFVPWFQPLLHIQDGKIHHYEALARMRDTDGKILFPGEFIDTAERFGLIGAIDRIITEKTMRLQAEMSRQGRKMSFAMNLSGKNLGDEELLSFLHSKIYETGADPSHLIFEITETAAVHDLDRAIRFINALKSTGCRFSLDDFGVGFTSFVYLKEMKVDYIKIDGSFIKSLHQNPNDQLFVKAITDVATGMGIKTVAEFVEKEETLKLLKEYGVDYAQGYLIGKPAPELLKDR